MFFLLVTASCGPSNQPKVQGSAAYNVLLITLDTTRADRMSLYGYGPATSPYLEQLAKRGIVFENAIAQAAMTNTSHASIFTGLYPYHHGVRFLLDQRLARLDKKHQTIAEIFKQSGAKTSAFISAVPASSDYGLEQGFDLFEESFQKHGKIAQRAGDKTTALAINWLRKNNDRFFSWVHLFDPHDPKLIPPFEICDQFRPADLTDDEAKLKAIYDAEILFLDMQIEKLIGVLEEKQILDKTIVVIAGDHGEGHGEHGFWGHGLIYQEQLRVPFMMMLPGGPADLRIKPMVRTIDIMPSLLRWAAIDPELWPQMDGVDLSPLLEKPTKPLVKTAYADATNMQWYSHLGQKSFKNDKYYALMDHRYKLIYHQLKPHKSELYDLQEDPGETKNRYHDLVKVKERLLADLQRRDPMIDEVSGLEGTPEETLEKLRSLGYTR